MPYKMPAARMNWIDSVAPVDKVLQPAGPAMVPPSGLVNTSSELPAKEHMDIEVLSADAPANVPKMGGGGRRVGEPTKQVAANTDLSGMLAREVPLSQCQVNPAPEEMGPLSLQSPIATGLTPPLERMDVNQSMAHEEAALVVAAPSSPSFNKYLQRPPTLKTHRQLTSLS